MGMVLRVSGLSAVAISTAGTLLCFLLPALAGLFMLDGDQHRMIALRALSAQHMLCLRRGIGADGGLRAGFRFVSADAAAKRAACADL